MAFANLMSPILVYFYVNICSDSDLYKLVWYNDYKNRVLYEDNISKKNIKNIEGNGILDNLTIYFYFILLNSIKYFLYFRSFKSLSLLPVLLSLPAGPCLVCWVRVGGCGRQTYSGGSGHERPRGINQDGGQKQAKIAAKN